MILIRTPSLEFNWLPNSERKALPTPRVVFMNTPGCGGFYSPSTEDRCIHPWVDMDLKEGSVIGVSESDPDLIAGTLAHEYRHHYQWSAFSGMSPSRWEPCAAHEYRSAIVRYFKTQWWEMDALRFQVRLAPDDVSMQWRDWIMESN